MKIIKFPLLLSIMVLIIFAYSWESPDVNLKNTEDISECIYDHNPQVHQLISNENNFKVAFVENSSESCINPYFPVVSIKTTAKHNAWIHIVRTNSDDKSLREFIDARIDQKHPYPFYTVEQDFYDAPLWTYKLFSNFFWEGHAYAVQVDHNKKTIKYVGGISWGFKLSFFHLRPQMILPQPLNIEAWGKDFHVFEEKLSGYENLNHFFSKIILRNLEARCNRIVIIKTGK